MCVDMASTDRGRQLAVAFAIYPHDLAGDMGIMPGNTARCRGRQALLRSKMAKKSR